MESAIMYHEKVGDSFVKLSDLYTRVVELPTTYIPTTLKIYTYSNWSTTEKDVTYNQQLELIRIYLKMISTETLSTEEQARSDQSDLVRGLIWNTMVDFMDSLINWLQTVIDL